MLQYSHRSGLILQDTFTTIILRNANRLTTIRDFDDDINDVMHEFGRNPRSSGGIILTLLMKILFLLALVASCVVSFDADLVDRDVLSTFNINIAESLYSGYLAVSAEGTAQFHYYFVLSDAAKPLTIWLNGGPGCSSAQGFFNENGPVHFLPETSDLVNNQYSWSKASNILYLESPAGVGFSYGPEQTHTDESTAQYNLQAVLSFFQKFPQFQDSKLFISGESYAGVQQSFASHQIYIPTLANAIIDYNAKAARRINLAGLLIGNGCTHPSECTNAYGAYPPHVFDYYGRHNLISESTYQLTKDNQEKCVGNFSDECLAISDKVNTEFSADLFINPYNVYGKCPIYSGRNGKSQAPLTYMLNPSLRDGGVPPCADVLGMFTYLRNPDFRRALHIPEILPTWDICSNIDYQVDDKASYYLYPKLIASGIRIWKFSGDGDAVVPITGTLYWVELLKKEQKLKTVVNWRPWFIEGDIDPTRQNAGNYYKLDGLTFVSVRAAGHMVPQDQRAAAYVMFENFLNGQDLPSS